jgi:hypothetical protein
MPLLYTENYLHFLGLDAITANVSIVIGNRIPNFNLTGNRK